MKAYRYSAPARPAQKPPDADAIMDQLAGHVLERDSLEEAMLELCKQGVEQQYGDSLDGLDRLTSKLQKQRRRLLDQYNMEPLLERLSEEIRSLVRRETEAMRRRFSEEGEKIDRKAESFLRKAAGAVEKMEQMRDGKGLDSARVLSRLENTFERLFLQKHKLEAESRALAKEEANRIAALKKLPTNPGAALKKLKDYKPVDPSVGEALSSLSEMADEIAAIERVQAQPGFGGAQSVDLDEAAGLVKKVLGIERLGAKLRKGNLSAADESRLSDTLGSDAVACVGIISKLHEKLLSAGYIEDDGEGLRLSPRAIRRVGQRALSDVFSNLGGGRLGGHTTLLKGAGEPDVFDTQMYHFGDSFNIHLGKTLMNSLRRGPASAPIDVRPSDFEVYAERHSTDCSSVLLLDLSHTMSQNGKLPAAKKVVLALDSLIRTRFPRDRLHVAGFSTFARELAPEDLPHVSINPGSPFTNIQDGLRLAAELISRDGGRSRRILLVTDGEPSAFCRDGKLCVDYPPTEEIFAETLKEVTRLTRKGIVINTFMLDDQPLLVKFVQQMTQINKGRAFFSTPQKLGQYLLVDYLTRHRRMIN